MTDAAEMIEEAQAPTLHQLARAWKCSTKTARRRAEKMGLRIVKIGDTTYCQSPRGREFINRLAAVQPQRKGRRGVYEIA